MLETYLKSIESLKNKVYEKSSGGLGYFGEYFSGTVVKRMGHLACFSGGLFALTAIYVDDLSQEQKKL